MMNVLLIYPEFPRTTYWSFSQIMPMIGRKASMPPLGLITVAGMLPAHYDAVLVDMNVEPLLDDQLRWADVVFTSTMLVQEPSLRDVIWRANAFGVPVVAGGPHPTAAEGNVEGADHVIVGEAEVVLHEFLADFEAGRARRVYTATDEVDISSTPTPRFDLLDLSAYSTMAVQYSRGCPFRCEFCDIWKLYGRRPRVKTSHQLLTELDVLYELGWRHPVFVVDDNFIGHQRRVTEMLIDLKSWQRERDFPFTLFTEASINLAENEELMYRMRDAGFSSVFVGIETPSLESLSGSNKLQNMRRDLVESVHAIQAHGMEVYGGFIVGFDEDTDDIFDRQIEFIESAAIPVAMVGLLEALPGTDLSSRLESEGRLLRDSDGNNTHQHETNFRTVMDPDRLKAGYRKIIERLYDKRLHHYFKRCRRMLSHLGPNPQFARKVRWWELQIFLRTLARIPTRRYGWEYVKFLLWAAIHHRDRFADAVRFGVNGFHFHAITEGALQLADMRESMAAREEELAGRLDAQQAMWELGSEKAPKHARLLAADRKASLRYYMRRVRKLPKDFRREAQAAVEDFRDRLDRLFDAPHRPACGARASETLASRPEASGPSEASASSKASASTTRGESLIAAT